ncbi:MAG: hypothetical protein IKN84_02765 [Bacteroidales bacterium]|jgi:hypothetical protein|nr:hypothetical protein [Bacteroidales bacterium]
MKKVFFALAVVAMFSLAACNGGAAATDSNNADTMANTENIVDEPTTENTDSSAVQEMAEETENTEATQEEATK